MKNVKINLSIRIYEYMCLSITFISKLIYLGFTVSLKHATILLSGIRGVHH